MFKAREQGDDIIFPDAAYAIMFSVKNFNVNLTHTQQLVIDHFFESLQFDNTAKDPLVSMVAFGNLMHYIDL